MTGCSRIAHCQPLLIKQRDYLKVAAGALRAKAEIEETSGFTSGGYSFFSGDPIVALFF
jgi:hypothetical protein